MSEYIIEKVSEQEPRLWKGPHGDVYYIKVKLKGVTKPVSIGKKAPDALHEGQTVYGNIEESDLPEDKWKPEPKPQDFTPSAAAPKTESKWVDHSDTIRAQWAIGQAVTTCTSLYATDKEHFGVEEVESRAKQYYAMVERVIASPSVVRDNQIAASFKNGTPVPDEVYEPEEEPINLDDIPF